MSGFSVIRERLELKYLIDALTARRIRRDIEGLCEPDPFNPPEGGYPLYSLYLDTPSQAFHRAKLDRDELRVKVRIRTYDETGPAFLEIKRKINSVIHKTRVGVSRYGLEETCKGYGVPLKSSHPIQQANLDAFAFEVARWGARPLIMVHYHREAFISVVDSYARVTFDCRLEAWNHPGWELDLKGRDRLHLDAAFQNDGLSSPTVLELKCERFMPLWMSQLIQKYALQRRGFSKFSFGVALHNLQERGLDGLANLRGGAL